MLNRWIRLNANFCRNAFSADGVPTLANSCFAVLRCNTLRLLTSLVLVVTFVISDTIPVFVPVFVGFGMSRHLVVRLGRFIPLVSCIVGIRFVDMSKPGLLNDVDNVVGARNSRTQETFSLP